jgi:uncharacterized protein
MIIICTVRLNADEQCFLINLALEHYEDREDKGYSLTDCMSMIVMENHAVQEVPTSDKHFRQAGFTILM